MQRSTILIAPLLLLFSVVYGQTSVQTAPPAKNSGIYTRMTTGILAGREASVSFHVFSGYAFNEHLQAGIGIGVESFSSYRHAPLQLEFRYHLLKRATSPFIAISGGYLAQLERVNSPASFTGGAAIGFTHYYTPHIGITTSAGFRYSSIHAPDYYTMPLYAPSIYYINNIPQVELRIGMVLR